MKSTTSLAVAFLMAIAAVSGCFGGEEAPKVPPKASFTITPLGGSNNSTFLFDASSSEGAISDYYWNFGEGTTANNPQAQMEYTITNVTLWPSLVIVDKAGRKATSFKSLTLGSGQNGAPEVHAKESRRWGTSQQLPLVIDASMSEDHDGDPISAQWYFGPWIDPAPPAANVASDVFDLGQSFNQVFSAPGTYFIHCHPHPWMKNKVVVDPDAQTGANLTVSIFNYAFGDGTPIVVSPNTTITFVNEDPIGHTVTSEGFAPGAKMPDGKVLSVPTGTPEGEYQAVIALTDHKGAFLAQGFGIKISSDAPQYSIPVVSGGALASTQPEVNHAFPSRVNFKAKLTFDVSYSPVASSTIQVKVVNTDTGSTAIDNAPCANNACTGSGNLVPGNFTYRVTVPNGQAAGAVTSYSITSTVQYYAIPGFGDTAGGHHH
jgi:plastocyanin